MSIFIIRYPFHTYIYIPLHRFSDDGRIIRYDLREPARTRQLRRNGLLRAIHSSIVIRATDTLQLSSEATAVAYHPGMEHVFATATSKGEVCLRDARTAFGTGERSGGSRVEDMGVVLKVSLYGSSEVKQYGEK
jgi:hypothetical protein